MTTLEQAARQALEALEESWHLIPKPDYARLATEALRQALEQPEQEPVAYSYTSRITGRQFFSIHPKPTQLDAETWDIKPLYTEPPKRKPLTDKQIVDCWNSVTLWTANPKHDFARAIEAAHGIKE